MVCIFVESNCMIKIPSHYRSKPKHRFGEKVYVYKPGGPEGTGFIREVRRHPALGTVYEINFTMGGWDLVEERFVEKVEI